MKKFTIMLVVILMFSINLFSADIIRAYVANFEALDIIYDEPISSVNASDYNLTGTAHITFASASIDPSDPHIVHLTGGEPSMISDFNLDTIADLSSSFVFYYGFTPISYTNTNYPGGQLLNGYDATTVGIVSANDGDNNVWIRDFAGGIYNGVMIYGESFDDLVNVGDLIGLCARRNVINGNTVLESPLLLYTTVAPPFGPDVINGSDINETFAVDGDGEPWEGQLVKIENVNIESYVDYDYRCTSDGGTTYFHVGDAVDNNFGAISLNVGSSYNIVGVVDWDNSLGNYRINPRDAEDIASLGILPENLIITVNGNNMDLIWTNFFGATSYNIYRSTDPNNFGSTVYDTSLTSTYTDIDGADGTKYFYRVTANY